jgi:hypothetical protein
MHLWRELLGIYFLMAIFVSSKVDIVESGKHASKSESVKSSKKDPSSYHGKKKIDIDDKMKTHNSKKRYKYEEEDVLEEPEDPLFEQQMKIEAAEEQQEIIQEGQGVTADGEVVDEDDEGKGDRNHGVGSLTMSQNAQDVSMVALNGASTEVYSQRIPQAFKPDQLISSSDASKPFYMVIYLSLSAVIIIYVFLCRKRSLLGGSLEESNTFSNNASDVESSTRSTLLAGNDHESL